MAKLLATPISPWTAVFRRIIAQVEADADVQEFIGVGNIRSWAGNLGEKQPLNTNPDNPVVIRLTPQPDHIDWFDPQTQAGSLMVLVDILVASPCIDDLIDIWYVVVSSVKPGGPSTVAGNADFAMDLVDLGAQTGEIVFSDPSAADTPEAKPDAQFYGKGFFKLDVKFPIYP